MAMREEIPRKPIHLREEELMNRLPEKIGKVTLDYGHYPGRDLYSDGAIENELLGIVRNAARVEYPSIIESKSSWPILYHLSPLRANIVDWLPIEKTAKVLEIGSGCGAITETLSRKAGEVVCVELSAKRSHINAYRNQDSDNITIHVGNFSDIEPSLPADFDYVCLIGVFEYGQSYIATQTPYEDFLKIMLRHVKEGGRLVIAIENRLGLKYFAGCKEDHLGTYFCGLEGYPEGGSARTFTRAGLKKILTACGVTEYSFYYPYPDYKFPTAIYSDRRLPHAGELTDNIRNFDRDRMVLFNEKYVFDTVIKDGMFPEFSNSYLVVIGKEPDISYVKYSNDRREDYAVRTQMQDGPGGRVIRKIPLTEQAGDHIRRIEAAYRLLQKRYDGSGLFINPCRLSEDGTSIEFPYENGVTLEELLDECLERKDSEEFYRLFDKYYSLISYGQESGVTDYDLIFANILVDGDRWTLIDYEWTMKKAVSAKEVAFRAVYCYVLEEEKRNALDFGVILDRLGITQKEAEEFRRREAKFQKKVTGKRMSMGEIRAAIGNYCVDPKALMEKHLQDILDKRIQVYFDSGSGFSEENSYYMPDVYVDSFHIEAKIPFDGNVALLRIDPADRPCVVKIQELALNEEPVDFSSKYVEANGRAVGKGTYVFATADPNFTVKVCALPCQGENVLLVRLELSFLPEEIAQELAQRRKRFF